MNEKRLCVFPGRIALGRDLGVAQVPTNNFCHREAMLIALIVWNVILTALVLYVVAGYLWHINKVHHQEDNHGQDKTR